MNTKRSFVAGLAALALGLAGLIGGAATVHAAGTAASVELTLEGKLAMTGGQLVSQGTFRSGAPFCATGTFVDEGPIRPGGGKRQFTCDDGTGTLTVSIAQWEYVGPPFNTTWQVLDGSGSYRNLRGSGSLQGEMLSHDGYANWRSTLQGSAERDAVAPSIAISRAKASKLRGRAGAYSIKVALALRDNVRANPVSFRLRVRAGGMELARKLGTTKTKAVSLVLRVRPPSKKLKTIRLVLTASDPVGNAASKDRLVKLKR
jgi:hypothetical protein